MAESLMYKAKVFIPKTDTQKNRQVTKVCVPTKRETTATYLFYGPLTSDYNYPMAAGLFWWGRFLPARKFLALQLRLKFHSFQLYLHLHHNYI